MSYDACIYNPDGHVVLQMERQFPGLGFSVFYLTASAARVRSHVVHRGGDPLGAARSKEQARAEKLSFLNASPRVVIACSSRDFRDIEFIVSALRLAIEQSRPMLFVTPYSLQPLIGACTRPEREMLKTRYEAGVIDFLESYNAARFQAMFSSDAN